MTKSTTEVSTSLEYGAGAKQLEAQMETAKKKSIMAAANRLKAARIRAGFPSAMGAAKYFGWKTSTYASHENGSAAIRPFWAALYAKAFGTTPLWIISGVDDGDGNEAVRLASLARSRTTNINPTPRPMFGNSIMAGSIPVEADQVSMALLPGGKTAKLVISKDLPVALAAQIFAMVNEALAAEAVEQPAQDV